MKIVVCDDSLEDLSIIEELLAEYKEHYKNINIDVVQFTDSTILYHKIQEEELGDIYILDMIMNNKTGIDLGTLIRSIDEKSVIIYITSSNEFALEAYSVHAVRYLLKPIRKDLFFEALDYAMSDAMKAEKDPEYQVKTKEGLVSVPYSRIEYVENYSRTLNISLTDGNSIKSIFIRKSFDEEVGQLLDDKRFLHVHKSFLVNMNHIDKLSQRTITMESGKNIPVSKTRAAEVKKEYLMFVSAKYRQGAAEIEL